MVLKVDSFDDHYLRSLEDIYMSACKLRQSVFNWPDMSNYDNSYVTDLKNQHYSIIKAFFDNKILENVKDEINHAFEQASLIQPPIRISSVSDVDNTNMTNHEIDRQPRLNDKELLKGEEYIKKNTSYIQLKEPLSTVPSLLSLVLDLRLLRLAQEYLGCFPLMTYVKVQRTWANSLPETNTQLWHVDIDAFKLLKAFIFLDDINMDGGATQFVKGSHFFADGKYEFKDRWSNEEVQSSFGRNNIMSPALAFGDLFLLDTLQIHRGSRPKNKDRTVIIANFCAHPEQASGGYLDLTSFDNTLLHPLQIKSLTTG